ncbi:unnamed protein product, partial [marine sediment metagenome]
HGGYRTIFSHRFAKAFWGEETMGKDGSKYEDYLKSCLDAGMTKDEALSDWEVDDDNFTISAWQYHLQQMVLEKEALKYLEKCL